MEALQKVSPSLMCFIASVAVGQLGESLNCKVVFSAAAQECASRLREAVMESRPRELYQPVVLAALSQLRADGR